MLLGIPNGQGPFVRKRILPKQSALSSKVQAQKFGSLHHQLGGPENKGDHCQLVFVRSGD